MLFFKRFLAVIIVAASTAAISRVAADANASTQNRSIENDGETTAGQYYDSANTHPYRVQTQKRKLFVSPINDVIIVIINFIQNLFSNLFGGDTSNSISGSDSSSDGNNQETNAPTAQTVITVPDPPQNSNIPATQPPVVLPTTVLVPAPSSNGSGGGGNHIVRTPDPTRNPTQPPVPFPVTAPTQAPVTTRPIAAPTTARPIAPAPSNAPTKTPSTARPIQPAPVNSPTEAPVSARPIVPDPVSAPTRLPVTARPIQPAPVNSPTRRPVTARPIQPAPVKSPSQQPVTARPIVPAPVKSPTRPPVTARPIAPAPVTAPTQTPVTSEPTPTPTPITTAPVTTPTTQNPTKTPTTMNPTNKPTLSPVDPVVITSPPVVNQPVGPPVAPPVPIVNPSGGPFNKISINAGGSTYTDAIGRSWISDAFVSGGFTYFDTSIPISDTLHDGLFYSGREGQFSYRIPLVNGNYEIVFHFAESSQSSRSFDIAIEGDTVLSNIDILALASGKRHRAVTLERAQQVSNGFLDIKFSGTRPVVSAIEVMQLAPHLAHSVSGGPYFAVDVDNTGSAMVSVDATESHTHAPGEELVSFHWTEGVTVIGTGIVTQLVLPVGEHAVSLTVFDSDGNEATEDTTIIIYDSSFPAISTLSPDNGSIAGGNEITIRGTGFSFSASQTIIFFGLTELSGSAVTIVNDKTIKVRAPFASVGTQVDITVRTPIGKSSAGVYTYIGATPIQFTSGLITRFPRPSSLAFGPDRRLYIGTLDGVILRLRFNDSQGGLKIFGWTQSTVAKFRAIMGIAFDPMDYSENPTIYFSHSFLFHGESRSSAGEAINGKISKISGANMDVIEDVITGIPVSDHDHGINEIEFGDNGELYFQVGGNTNGGLPGQITSLQIQEENILSAATLVAQLGEPSFDGNVRYTKNVNGDLVGGNGGFSANGIAVFAHGLRNPYGLCLHSNGRLYGTDNGPNLNYGDMMTDCNGGRIADVAEEDKLVLLENNNYYGHPNPKRGETDPRQCVFRRSEEPSDNEYTAYLMEVEASADGLIEFHSNHFEGQLRGNLVYSKYNGDLYRVILSSDGRDAIEESKPALPLIDGVGLTVTQHPDGLLIEARLQNNQIWFHRPDEPATSALKLNTVFPRRGTVAGGNVLGVYGKNLNKGASPVITVGGKNCAIVPNNVLAHRILCTLPGGSGTVDVSITVGGETSVFHRGYRYITGLPV